jgi:hypothetical protein
MLNSANQHIFLGEFATIFENILERKSGTLFDKISRDTVSLSFDMAKSRLEAPYRTQKAATATLAWNFLLSDLQYSSLYP